MRFPGQRIAKHYFPVTGKATRVVSPIDPSLKRWYLLGLDEVIVDIELRGPANLARELGLVPGESIRVSDDQYAHLLGCLREQGGDLEPVYSAGGSVANTLNNYTYLSGEPSVLLGAIQGTIHPGDPAFSYVAQTPKAVSLRHVLPVQGAIGTAITFISPDGERSFGVAPGVSGEYPASAIPDNLVHQASVVLASLYCLTDNERPIAGAAHALMTQACEADVPVAFGLGTAGLVRGMRKEVKELLADYVTVAAMNDHEAEALTGESDALLACRMMLDWVDVVVITQGPKGLTMGGYVDHDVRRETTERIRTKSIPEYNRWEFSRLMRRRDCPKPEKIFTRIHPYRGGPDRLHNTNGAGDAALAAILHDLTANHYHRNAVPDSVKHPDGVRFLTYSSLSRNAQYGNRVAYEVLRARSPRIDSPVGHDEGDD